VFFLEFGFGLANVLDRLFHLFVELVALLSQHQPLFLAQVPQILLGHGFPFLVGGDDHHSDLGELQNEPLVLCLLRELIDDFPALLLEGLVYLAFLGPVVVAVENLGDFGLQRIDELIHVFLERLAPTGRHFKTLRFVLFLEIEDIAPVGGRRFLARPFLDERFSHERQTGLGGPRDEDIVAARLHAHTELYGVDGPFLPHHTVSRSLQGSGRLKGKCFRFDVCSQFFH